MTRFGIIGAGWRTEFFLRVARELPGHFGVVGVVVRDAAKADALRAKWAVPTYGSLSELLQADAPSFVVAAVPWEATPGLLMECAERKVPVLAETPPAPDIARLTELTQLVRQGAVIQVAEQYVLQPLHQALLSVAHSGLIGTPSHAQVSVAHGYHGMSLLRRYLGIGFENVSVTATKFSAPIMESPGRQGPPSQSRVVNSDQIIAHLRFENNLSGVYDFSGDQYFSFVRGARLLIRGEKGEIVGDPGGNSAVVRHLLDPTSAVTEVLRRVDTGHGGNLEGYHHRGYTFGGNWIYRNLFAALAEGYVGGHLSDDEIAIATILSKMGEYVRGEGPPPYSLADAAQDRYLDLLIEEAARTGQTVHSKTQDWAP